MKWPNLVLCLCLALSLPGTALAETRAEQAEKLRKSASVTFTGEYEVPSPIATVRAALERPFLMGTLWDSYMYGPGYKVTRLSEPRSVHVIDPSGMEGDVWPVASADGHIAYLAEGKIKHWAVPVLNTGEALFDFALAPKGAGTLVTVTVLVKPESRMAGAALWLMTPIVKGRIKSRVTNNMRDASNILRDMSSKPTAVAARLKDDLRQNFERVFIR